MGQLWSIVVVVKHVICRQCIERHTHAIASNGLALGNPESRISIWISVSLPKR
jgi:hypothetical protein